MMSNGRGTHNRHCVRLDLGAHMCRYVRVVWGLPVVAGEGPSHLRGSQRVLSAVSLHCFCETPECEGAATRG